MALRNLFGAMVLAGLACATPVRADSVVSELKGGVLVHDVGLLGADKEGGLDLNLELLFASPDLLHSVWAPRPHLGLQVNTAGDTSQAYAGLTWTARPASLPVWGAFSLGGAVHNGETGRGGPGEKELGSRALFRLAAEVGYDITPQVNVSVVFDHESNAHLADRNEGLNNVGVRLGYRF